MKATIDIKIVTVLTSWGLGAGSNTLNFV